ncbi:hypothetical protein [Moorena sp. SIO4G3]|uniref:hypothetical protein n=1 Tax=Moorena sp. SIO4G3 TaxID=2607821 RepID=UPI00142CC227|nr:hypothetical protein [Moorena sp. SIO4G3]NEO75687.1 hypothetical protein [Moorena sp. SIO4G3]
MKWASGVEQASCLLKFSNRLSQPWPRHGKSARARGWCVTGPAIYTLAKTRKIRASPSLTHPTPQFPIPDSRLPTPDSRLPVPCSLFPVPCSLFPTPF